MAARKTKESEVDYSSILGVAFRIIIALALVGTGLVFFTDNTGTSVMGGNWWVMYLIISAVGFGVASFLAYRRAGHFDSFSTGFAVLTVILAILSIIFLFDPTWSFTREWRWTLFSDINWNRIWPVFLILLGVVLLFAGRRRHHQ